MFRDDDFSEQAIGFNYFRWRTGRATPKGPLERELAETPLTRLPQALGHSTSVRSPFVLGDFSNGFALAMGQALTQQLAGRNAHRQLCLPIPCRDFKEISVPSLSISLGLSAIPESGNYGSATTITLSDSLSAAGVSLRGGMLGISRQVVESDSIALIGAALREIARSCAIDEMAQLSALLESTAVLDDGLAFTNTTSGNLAATGAAPSVTTLAAASSWLGAHALPAGDVAGSPVSFLVCAPSLWPTVSVLVGAMEVETRPRIVTLPTASSDTRWFAMSAPEFSATVGLCYLGEVGSPPETVRIERAGLDRSDTHMFRISSSFRFAPLSRDGIFSNPGA